MPLVVPPEFKAPLKSIFNRLGGTFADWLEYEHRQTLGKLADAREEFAVRQLQGRARMIKDLLDEIKAAQS